MQVFHLILNYQVIILLKLCIYSNDARDVICAYYYYTDGGSEQGWHFGYNSSNLRLNFRNANSNTQVVSETGSVLANRWYHVAVVTRSGSSQIYINGKASGAAVDIGTPTTTNVRFTVGGLVYASESSGYGNYFDGFISNLRIIKGTALYTGNFTPPARTLTNVTNTKLLCCQKPTTAPIGFTTITATGALPIYNTNDTGITTTSGTRSDANSSSLVLALPLLNNSNDVHADIKGSGSNKTITENGNVTSSSAQSQFYGGSYIFDGNADYFTFQQVLTLILELEHIQLRCGLKPQKKLGPRLWYDADGDTGLRICIGNNGLNNSNVGKFEVNEQVSNGDVYTQSTSRVEWKLASC